MYSITPFTVDAELLSDCDSAEAVQLAKNITALIQEKYATKLVRVSFRKKDSYLIEYYPD